MLLLSLKVGQVDTVKHTKLTLQSPSGGVMEEGKADTTLGRAGLDSGTILATTQTAPRGGLASQ
jgi:hypothetical protein